MSGVTRYLAVAVVAFAVAFASAWVAQGWRADAEIADIRAAAARQMATATETVARLNEDVLKQERRQADSLAQMEASYVELSEARARLAGENDRLSHDLNTALERLRRAGTGPRASGAGVSVAPAAAGGCEGVRAARDAAVAAVERLVAGGRTIVEQGHDGVTVATLAARAARDYSGAQ